MTQDFTVCIVQFRFFNRVRDRLGIIVGDFSQCFFNSVAVDGAALENQRD